MDAISTCAECGARLSGSETCQDHFYQMLFWENEFPEYGVVHHLMVLCYHLQHPSLYSPEGLSYAQKLLADFVEGGLSTQEVRRRRREQVDSGNRDWKVTARDDAQGAYRERVAWRMTPGDVVANGAESYLESVQNWAARVLEDLKVSGNFPRS